MTEYNLSFGQREQLSKIENKSLYPNERWGFIPNTDNTHMASDYGRLFSFDRVRDCKDGKRYKIKGGLVKPFPDSDGYLRKCISYNGVKYYWKVARLVAYLFVDGWDEKLDVNHIDFNKQNNYYKNLNYLTRGDNNKYSRSAGRIISNIDYVKESREKQKKPIIQLSLDGKLIKIWDCINSASKVYPNRCGIRKCANGIFKQSQGFKWEFKIK